MYIEKIASPADVKKLDMGQLVELAGEMRQCLIKRGSIHGGHFGPNLGMVEATIALHYVFNSPEDKLVFDVSHQSYPHKMLTGRAFAYTDPERYDEVSGYSEPTESEHDHFVIGHTSTSVSLASGLAKGRDIVGGRENVVAIIGDGSLSGGEAFEGLNVGAELDSNFIVVVNDNQMSIAENHGGLYRNLQQLRDTNGEYSDNYFRTLGYDYLYVGEGNNIEALVEAFSKVKDSSRPVVVHINTEKGHGYAPAVSDKESWHYSGAFDVETGKPVASGEAVEDYQSITAEHLLKKMKDDPKVVAITAGTPAVMGFNKARREQAGRQFVDVGIAEEQAVAMASGIAKAGARPVFGVFSCFATRACDQLQQDLCINGNPAVMLVFWGSMASMNDVTHLCWWDIPLIANVPNMVYLAPTNCEEYLAMLDWSLRQTEHPVAIRVPMGAVTHASAPVAESYGNINSYEVVKSGSEVAIIGVGHYLQLALSAASELESRYGINATVINPRFISGVDTELMDSLSASHSIVVTLEDGALEGGFGAKIAQHFAPTSMRVLCRGAKKVFEDRYSLSELLQEFRLTPELIAEDVKKVLNYEF